MAYVFTPVTDNDLSLLDRWLRNPHVREWWDDDSGPEDEEEDEDEALQDASSWPHIVHLDGRPIGYIQAYDPHAWPGHHFADQPPGTRGIDQYIGEPEFLNQGHGPAFIRQFCDNLFAAGAPVIVTDPHPDNTRAIRAYQKAGFVRYSGPVSSDWGVCLLMARKAGGEKAA
jgi:aminoglycoside 6'-N-acetyltransferase